MKNCVDKTTDILGPMFILRKTKYLGNIVISYYIDNIGIAQLCMEQNIDQMGATTSAVHLYTMLHIFDDA